ncbi:uncharacterized protein SCHCODRAFT_02611254 [Schizophyllum commune H4-8]|nr:uncharacterized protein SCHCODRAFT_02611254 [Schizophyllum commune H4-8]KAI5898145.1 hypothetical protein SCHCODRAFT_02611254 [Schizophyllum commune H4-8]
MSNTGNSKALIDDQSSNVTFHGQWEVGGAPNEYNETVSSTRTAGDSFEVRFNGWLIAVYGTLDYSSDGVRTNYSIDNGEATTVTSRAGAGDTYKQIFFTSDGFDVAADHTLTVTMDYVNTTYEEGEGTIWFDYFEIYGNLGDAINSAEMPTGTDAGSTPASSTSVPPTSSHAVNTGAIIGGTIGGVFLLSLGIVCVLVYYARRGQREPTRDTASAQEKFHPDYLYLPRNAVIQPFIMSSTESPGPRKKTIVAETEPSALVTPQNPVPSTGDSTDIQGVVVGTALTAVVEHEPDPELQMIDVIRHTDSGLRGIEIPPEYTAE